MNENEEKEVQKEEQKVIEEVTEEVTEKDDIVAEIKKGYEERILDLNKQHTEEVEKYKQVIKQLVKGETAKPTTIADKIKSQRKYKVW